MSKITSTPKIVPFLWFDKQAEEAAKYYVGIFPDSSLDKVEYYPKGGPFPDGTVMSAQFTLAGQKIYSLNAGPIYKLTPAFSLFVHCEDQKEVDFYWNKLTDGGQEQPCGWLVDKFGLSWQIIPKQLEKYMHHPDKNKAGRAIQAMMKMKKIIVADLEKAAEG